MTYSCSSQLFNWRVQEEDCCHDCTSTFSKSGDLDIVSVLAMDENVPLLNYLFLVTAETFNIRLDPF